MAFGEMTGLELSPQRGRGRPQRYINADARKLAARLAEVERLIAKLAIEVGFTPAKARQLRGDLFAAGNGLNRNIHPEAVAERRAAAKKAAAARRRNPSGDVHALLMHGQNGERLTVCGFVPCSRTVDGVWICHVHITQCAELVDCPDCIAAGGPSEPAQ